jgi:hypothetical protein
VLHQMEKAKRICRTCPVRMPCLTWALDQAVSAGIWGATAEDELACSSDGTVPVAGMSFPAPDLRSGQGATLRFLLAPMRGIVDVGTLFTWRGSVS